MSNLDKTTEQLEKLLDERIEGSEREIAKQYAVLLSEVKKEIAKLYEQYEKDGALTYAEMAKYDRLNKFLTYINQLLTKNYQGLKMAIYAVLGEIYTNAYYQIAWSIETDSLSRLAYSSVTPETITKMIENPIAGLTLSQTLEKNRSNIVYKIQQEVTQGLVKGESYRNMAKRLTNALEGDVRKAVRIAHTEAHRVQESAKHDSVEHANRNGVIMNKKWNSVGDERVRHEKNANHRKLNGTKIPVDQDFKQGRGKGKGPGMMMAPEHDIYDRCFLTYSIEKIEKPDAKELEGMAFDMWKEERLR
jgi:uncharacterized protein with gpF-like domain